VSWVPSVEYHGELVALIRLARLHAGIDAELDRLRGELSEAQRDGRACAQCGREDRPMRPLVIRDGLSLFVCAAHDASAGGGGGPTAAARPAVSDGPGVGAPGHGWLVAMAG